MAVDKSGDAVIPWHSSAAHGVIKWGNPDLSLPGAAGFGKRPQPKVSTREGNGHYFGGFCKIGVLLAPAAWGRADSGWRRNDGVDAGMTGKD